MTNLVCKGNPKYITFHVYKINAIRRGVQKLYYNYTFMTRVEEMWTEFQTFKRYGNVYQPFVIKWDPESCKSKALLLEKPSVNNVGMMLLQTIVKDESGCHPCPMLVDIFWGFHFKHSLSPSYSFLVVLGWWKLWTGRLGSKRRFHATIYADRWVQVSCQVDNCFIHHFWENFFRMTIELHDVAGQNYATIEIFCKVSTTQ